METKFNCECNGCRNYPTFPAQIWHKNQIPSKEQGTYFFKPDTMKFFKSRIVDFVSVQFNQNKNASLSVLVSSAGDFDNTFRAYEIVSLCPYGRINRNSRKYDTIKQARKDWNNIPASEYECDCHGCVIDKQDNRNQRETLQNA